MVFFCPEGIQMRLKPDGTWADIVRLSSVGLVLAICVGLGAWGGVWLDNRWGTDPWMTVVGVVLGSVAGFMELVREVGRHTGKDE